MGWKIDKSTAKFGHLGAAAQKKWDEFQNAIQHQGVHPSVAAQGSDSDYKAFKNTKCGQHQIRLDYSDRATFTVDDTTRIIKVLQVGGHT